MARYLSAVSQWFTCFPGRRLSSAGTKKPPGRHAAGRLWGGAKALSGGTLTLLQPAIIQAILAGQQPRCMSLLWFQRNPLPTDWVAQREVVAGFDA
ncbi:hypothetical protein [Diaphorobacter sp.]|uniref:hypothetical protein n=1 Tax=Diaphorobacter sp. TaxID=1934310 RepID=UPI00258314E3|nr:hypothetical protein [Diaphorobacter sp.]